MASGLRTLIWAGSLLLAGAVGCGKSSPTEPPPIGNTMIFDVTISNTAGKDTLQTLGVSLDGLVVAGSQNNRNYAIDNFSHPQLQMRGHHTLTLTIASQSESPSRYTASVDVVLGSPTFPTGFNIFAEKILPQQTATLATGESITWAFDI
jgi:hypothetical protein